jgi:hypothetical protein
LVEAGILGIVAIIGPIFREQLDDLLAVLGV